jgi:hypothetical protein
MKPSAPESYSDYIQWSSGPDELETVPPAYPFRAIMVNFLSTVAYNVAVNGPIDIEYLTSSEETRIIQVSPGVNLPSGPFIRSRIINISGKKILSITASNRPINGLVQVTLLI